MFSNDFLDRYQRLVDSERVARKPSLSREIGKERAVAAKHGMSGHHLLHLAEIHRNEITIRAALCWKAAVRILRDTSFGTDGDLRADLKELIKASMTTDFSELVESLSKYVPEKYTSAGTDISAKFDEVLFRHEVEIDLFVDARSKAAPDTLGQNHYNFYGNVGAVQSGAYANATVTLTIGASEKTKLLDAIAGVEAALQQADQTEIGNRTELLEIASECKNVLGAPEPNRTKLAIYLDTLAASIQGIASAGPAYEALRSAIELIG